MNYVEDIAALEALYEAAPAEAALVKVARRMTPLYREWIARARFCILATVGPEGADASPRGDDGPVVRELDPGTLAMPDWHGNNRIDTLRNIVRDGRIALIFLVPGSDNAVRVNGSARLTADTQLRETFAREGRLPRSVIVISVDEIYIQCARALKRARLWSAGDESGGLPSAGAILEEMSRGRIDGAAYDAAWPKRAADTMW